MKRTAMTRTTPLRAFSRKRRRYEDEFRVARHVAMSLAGWRCEAQAPGCTVYALDVHHKLPRSRGGGNEADNLMAVCRSCHRWIEANRAQAKALGWLR